MATGIERQRELRRRRKRRQKIGVLKRKLTKANTSDKEVIANKIRRLTPGAGDVLENLNLAKS